MQTITVSRNDEIYEAFADVAQAADGTLVCTYRESMGHSSRPFSRVIVRRSFDRGLTWSPRLVGRQRLFGLGATTRWDALRSQLHHRRCAPCPHSRLCSGPRGLVSLSRGGDSRQSSLVEQSSLLRQGPANGP